MKTNISNGVRWYQTLENSDGAIVMVEPKTIQRYIELKKEEPDSRKYGVFFAFGDDQFKQGMDMLKSKGYLKEGEKVCSVGAGMYGVRKEIDRYFEFFEQRGKKIAKECNAQEVYFYEWNNHECMYADDDEVVKLIVSYFGKETAHQVKRVGCGTDINILAPLTERDEHLQQYEHNLMMLSRFEWDCKGFFGEHDCRRHRPSALWGGCISSLIEEMRKLYNQLPDDIKDASCMTKEQIEEYARRLDEWADEEFAKSEYDPVPATPIKECRDMEIILDDCLYYTDDEGHLQKPTHVWFSNDTRRFTQDERNVHGRAYTCYLGKKGTTLTPVYKFDDRLQLKAYTRTDLCDITARFDASPLKFRLYDFHKE